MKRKAITISSSDEIIPLCMDLLISRLQSDDGAERTHAREALVKIGKPVIPHITTLLTHPHGHVRWEACKTMERIRDPKTASMLSDMLMDDDMDVRWVAANALIELEYHAIVPVLEILEKNFDSATLRQGAHHVLYALKRMSLLDEKTEQVLNSLNVMELPSKAALIANQALDYVRTHKPVRRRHALVLE
jgi:hypothetical protein